MTPPMSMGMGVGLHHLRTAVGGAAAADWELVSSQDLSVGSISSVVFEDLDLGNTYMLVGRHMKATSTGAIPYVRFKYGSTDYSVSNSYIRETDGRYMDVSTVSTGAGSSGTNTGSSFPFDAASGGTLLDATDTVTDDIDGLSVVMFFRLYDQGVSDSHVIPVYAFSEGHYKDTTKGDASLSVSCYGACANNIPATAQLDGVVLATTGTFAAISGSRVALYKYIGGLL